MSKHFTYCIITARLWPTNNAIFTNASGQLIWKHMAIRLRNKFNIGTYIFIKFTSGFLQHGRHDLIFLSWKDIDRLVLDISKLSNITLILCIKCSLNGVPTIWFNIINRTFTSIRPTFYDACACNNVGVYQLDCACEDATTGKAWHCYRLRVCT